MKTLEDRSKGTYSYFLQNWSPYLLLFNVKFIVIKFATVFVNLKIHVSDANWQCLIIKQYHKNIFATVLNL